MCGTQHARHCAGSADALLRDLEPTAAKLLDRHQILRPWRVTVAYIYEYTDYTDSNTANLSNPRLSLSTEYALREWLVLGLSYRYGAQREHGGNVSQAGVNEFTDNQVMLTVTASPKFRF